jgi:sucrose phosphorylase
MTAYIFDQRFLDMPVADSAPSHQPGETQRQRRDELLALIWPEHDQATLQAQFFELLDEAQKRLLPENLSADGGWSEQELVFICYGDHLRSRDPQIRPLQALKTFFQTHFPHDIFSKLTVHLLPIYASPYKDGGFDITDPFQVNPAMGTWDDVRALRKDFRVALDFVANHVSITSEWFRRYLREDPLFQDFFIGFDNPDEVKHFEQEYLPNIYRPRPHNPLIPVMKPDGSPRWVYMTFSDHQADVNYANPFVFLKMLETLLFYVLQGTGMIRLDAIPYLWKEWGTSCAHHAKTHALVELFRLAVDAVNPTVKLLAESMEPLADSQRYLSTDQEQKAHLAYNFVPCGLIPHTLLTGDTSIFQQHLADFLPPRAGVNWAVVCGVTHDGSSMNPCRAPKSVQGAAILDETHITTVADYYTKHGEQELEQRMMLDADDPGAIAPDYWETFTKTHQERPRFVNYKTIVDDQGQVHKVVYEAISTYGSLFDQQPNTIVAALSMALALPGIPFVYLTLPFAHLNDFAYYLQTGNPRELNRGRVVLENLFAELKNPDTVTAKVFSKYMRFLELRVTCPAFHPDAQLIPVETDNSAIVAFIRVSVDDAQRILVVQNASAENQQVSLPLHGLLPRFENECRDLLSGDAVLMDTQQNIYLDALPFEGNWIELYRKARNSQ